MSTLGKKTNSPHYNSIVSLMVTMIQNGSRLTVDNAQTPSLVGLSATYSLVEWASEHSGSPPIIIMVRGGEPDIVNGSSGHKPAAITILMGTLFGSTHQVCKKMYLRAISCRVGRLG